jgi:putative holliday junction resolvase
MGVDYGLKRIGVALTDPLGLTAQPSQVVLNEGAEAVVKELVGRAESYEVSAIIVGLPLNMDGSEGPMAELVHVFVAQLRAALPASVEVLERDERLTSWTAEQETFAKGGLPWHDKGKIDTRAAMILLEDHLAEGDPSRGMILREPTLEEAARPPGRGRRGRGRDSRSRGDRRR